MKIIATIKSLLTLQGRIVKIFTKERRLRKSATLRAENRCRVYVRAFVNSKTSSNIKLDIIEEKIKDIEKEIHRIGDLDKLYNSIIPLDGLASQMRKALTEVRAIIKDAAYIENLVTKANKEYRKLLAKAKADLGEYKETDNAIMRLADLEKRITLMEVSNDS